MKSSRCSMNRRQTSIGCATPVGEVSPTGATQRCRTNPPHRSQEFPLAMAPYIGWPRLLLLPGRRSRKRFSADTVRRKSILIPCSFNDRTHESRRTSMTRRQTSIGCATPVGEVSPTGATQRCRTNPPHRSQEFPLAMAPYIGWPRLLLLPGRRSRKRFSADTVRRKSILIPCSFNDRTHEVAANQHDPKTDLYWLRHTGRRSLANRCHPEMPHKPASPEPRISTRHGPLNRVASVALATGAAQPKEVSSRHRSAQKHSDSVLLQ